METYRLEHKDSKTDVLTTDFLDVWNELAKIPDGDTLKITKKEMTRSELEDTLKERGIMNLSINTPWKNEPE